MNKTVSVLALTLLCTMAAAHASAIKSRTYHHPVKITICRPSRGTAITGGFSDAYYPGYPYYWDDVYGNRFDQPPVRSDPRLAIAYSNATNHPMREIEFGLLARGRLVAEVRDVGTFSPGAQIRHVFGLSPNAFPLSTSFPKCVPLRVTFTNGSIWKNPHLPALQRSIYSLP
ncbi:MAG: hypothetical protein HKL92_08345 [Candidatus Eremiobacteraeota bacterium]|nr:hypothetical protein [Candidatus Eremiobacteraeota bacterium]NNM93337.1 hypothetical protein [Candidatus Eremiobacteraeota bacterium]